MDGWTEIQNNPETAAISGLETNLQSIYNSGCKYNDIVPTPVKKGFPGGCFGKLQCYCFPKNPSSFILRCVSLTLLPVFLLAIPPTVCRHTAFI